MQSHTDIINFNWSKVQNTHTMHKTHKHTYTKLHLNHELMFMSSYQVLM